MATAPSLPFTPPVNRYRPSAPTLLGANRRFTRSTWFDPITTVFAWLVCIIIDIWAMASSRELLHWFILPLTLCGVVMAHDCVNWFRRKMDVFDPIGAIGFLGFHFFYLANLLQFVWNIWLIPVEIRAPDIRPWIGWISMINLVCLLLYRHLRDPLAGRVKPGKRTVWVIDHSRFQITIIVMLVTTAVLQFMVYYSWGGIANYMNAIATRAQKLTLDTGFVSAIAESAPILIVMGYVIAARRRPAMASWPALIAFMTVYFVLVMLFGGLRGSRANTVWAMFWAAGMVHFMLRPISKKVIFAGLFVVAVFMYMYGFYKAGGANPFRAMAGGADLEYLEHKTGRSLHALLVGDLARGEIHAFFLRQLFNRDLDYDLAWGRTYYGTISRIVPAFIWPNRPAVKNKESTEIQYGKGTYDEVNFSSSFAHGLGAEAMMNFGVAGIMPAYLLWTLFVARVRKWVLTWDPNDMRLLIAPILINLCVVALMGDSDNIFQFIFKNASMPMLLLWLTTRRVHSAPAHTAYATGYRGLRGRPAMPGYLGPAVPGSR